jgi:hypothetical protein
MRPCGRAIFPYAEVMITVETTETDVRVTIPKDAMPADRLNSFLDWLRLEALTSRSALSDTVADDIAEKLKAEWWASNKDRFVKTPGR